MEFKPHHFLIQYSQRELNTLYNKKESYRISSSSDFLTLGNEKTAKRKFFYFYPYWTWFIWITEQFEMPSDILEKILIVSAVILASIPLILLLKNYMCKWFKNQNFLSLSLY